MHRTNIIKASDRRGGKLQAFITPIREECQF
jgi:hypothetical protein